mgnify:CR=1 FL=1
MMQEFETKNEIKSRLLKEAAREWGYRGVTDLDLDAFDPSILPATGTPEPGGLMWYESLEFFKKVFEQKNVVGFDIVEFCPNPNEKSSDFLAAKLYYKLLTYKFELNKKGEEIEENSTTNFVPIGKNNKFNNKDN